MMTTHQSDIDISIIEEEIQELYIDISEIKEDECYTPEEQAEEIRQINEEIHSLNELVSFAHEWESMTAAAQSAVKNDMLVQTPKARVSPKNISWDPQGVTECHEFDVTKEEMKLRGRRSADEGIKGEEWEKSVERIYGDVNALLPTTKSKIRIKDKSQAVPFTLP